MNAITKFFTSSVGKKYLMSLTGLALCGFLAMHLLGNLQLMLPGKLGQEWFNKYAYHLETLKPLVIAAELGLIALIGVHILVALTINFGVRKARPVGYYASEKTKGGESHSNLSSRNMLILGLVIVAFVVMHVWQFKYGAYYKTTLDKTIEARDLYKLVVEKFSNPVWALVYVGALGFLGFHLRHGIWSAFQSLGAMPGKSSKALYCVGALLAALMALGFIVLPLWIFAAAHLKLIQY